MKTIHYKNSSIISILLIAFSFLFVSCEEVVNVNLDTAPPKLVIEGSINWEKGTLGNIQKIKLSTTTSYYSNVIPVVSGAIVTVTNSSNTLFNFIENPGTGDYICTNFIPVFDEEYTLTIVYNGETYTGKEILKSVATITTIQQETIFLDKEYTQLKAKYNDPVNAENYYMYRYTYPNTLLPEYLVDEDRFYNGNVGFSLILNEELVPNDQVEIVHYGISKRYFNYMIQLLSISGNNTNGGPFSTPPATVRGNMINTTNPDNFPFGYFRLSETDTRNYTVQ